MFSSTMVTVIAPQWSGRFRRPKKDVVGLATGEAEQEAQGGEQDVGKGGRVPTLCDPQERTSDHQNQVARERGEIPGCRAQERASRGTLGWLSERNPNSMTLDSPTNRPVTKSNSLGVDWGRLDNREGVVATPVFSSSGASPQTPTSPLSPQLHAHRGTSQAGRHGDQLSSLSTKPTTSSILLSLRRFNSNWMNTHIGSAHPEATPTLPSSTNDGTPASPPSRLPQTSRVYPPQSYSVKQTILASGLERQASSQNPGLNSATEVELTSAETPPHSRRLDFVKSRSLPRGTMLTSTSWWKHVEESDHSPGSPLSATNNNVNNNVNNKNTNRDNTSLFVFPSFNKNDGSPRAANSNTSCTPENIHNINNNNLSQSVAPNNRYNMLEDTQIKSSPLRWNNTQELPDQRSHTSLLTRAVDPRTQKAHSLSSVSYRSKISSALSPAAFSSSTVDLTRPETSLNQQPCKSNAVETAQFYLRSKSLESSTSTSFSISASSQSSNTPASPDSDLSSGLLYRPHSLQRASSGRASVGQDYHPSSSKSPTPSSVLASQRSTEKRTPIPTSRLFSLASYTPKPFSTNTSVPRSISIKTSTNLPPPSHTPLSTATPLHSQPTSTSTKPPLPSKAPSTPTHQPLSPTNQITSPLPDPGLLLPQERSPLLGERMFTDGPVLSAKKQCSPAEGRGIAGRTVWHNSVELQRSDTTTRGPNSSEGRPARTGPLSPSRPLRSVEGPSIFAFLRSGSSPQAVAPLSPPGARASSLQMWRGDEETRRELEEREGRDTERESDEQSVLSGGLDRSVRFTFNPLNRGLAAGGEQRRPSEETTFCLDSAASLSLPLDSGRKLRISTPSYQDFKAESPVPSGIGCSTLTPTSLHYKPPTPPPNYSPLSPPTSPPKPLYSLPLSPPVSPNSPHLSGQRAESGHDHSKVVVTETDSVNNNCRTTQTRQAIQDGGAPHPTPPEIPIDDISPSQPLPTSCSRVTVVETLVYSIPKASSYSGTSNCVRLTHSYTALQGPHTYTVTARKTYDNGHITGHPACQSTQSSNESSAVGNQCTPTVQSVAEKESERGGRQGDSVPVLEGKSAIAPSQNLSSKRGLFGLKLKRESVAAGLTCDRDTGQSMRDVRAKEIEKQQSGTAKMDLLSRLKQTFKRSDDEILTSRSQKKRSLTTSVSGVTPGDEGTASREEGGKASDQWRRDEREGDRVSVWADKVGTDTGNKSTDRVENKHLQFGVFRGQHVEESRQWPSMTNQSPTGQQHSDLHADHGLDDGMGGRRDGRGDAMLEGRWCQSRQLPSYRERSPAGLQRSPYSPATLPTHRASSTSPRSPNSPCSPATLPTHRASSTSPRSPNSTCSPATLPTHRASSASPRSPNSPCSPATLPTHRASSASPRSPYSPVLGHKMSPSSPLSPCSLRNRQVSAASRSSASPLGGEEWESDSVFLSPDLPPTGWRKATSLCEPVEEEEARGHGSGSRVRSRDGGRLASFSSCADLKYGLEAGRSFSVSSVLSSRRPSGLGRISTGTRIASASDLTDLRDPAMTFGGVATWGDDYSGKGDWTASKSGFGSGSKSLPRSLLRSSTWGSEVDPERAPTTVTTTGQGGGSSRLGSSHSMWDTEGPLTPPPSPPWSPTTQRISRASSSSLPDSQTTKGRLPTRGYLCSLSAFDESSQDQDSVSDSASDTTTDDEYCLGDEDEKETEL